MCQVVLDAHSEVISRRRRGHLVKDRLDHGGSELFGTKSVAAAYDSRSLLQKRIGRPGVFADRRHNVLIEWFAQAAWFFGSVKNGYGLSGRRQTADEISCGKRTE